MREFVGAKKMGNLSNISVHYLSVCYGIGVSTFLWSQLYIKYVRAKSLIVRFHALFEKKHDYDTIPILNERAVSIISKYNLPNELVKSAYICSSLLHSFAKRKCLKTENFKIKDFKLYQKSIKDKMLNQSARQGIITLLEKSGRDPLYLKHWRPLTMF